MQGVSMSEQPVPFAMKCNATGPGIGGGAAGVEAQFTITCADADGSRIRTGGAKIQISVLRVGLLGVCRINSCSG